MRIPILKGIVLYTICRCAAQTVPDQHAITQLVEDFCIIAVGDDGGKKVQDLFASDYVHITPDGIMTKSWRIASKEELRSPQSITVDKLNIRVFGDFAVAAYLWRVNDSKRTSTVMQAFQKRSGGWRVIATQVGGPDPVYTGPITAGEIVPATNPPEVEAEVRQTWARFMTVNMRTANGEVAEDMDTVRSVVAEDAMYVMPNGNVMAREERLALGHPNAKQLTGDRKRGAVVVATKHLDEQVAIFGNAAVWTSRNPAPAYNGNQAFRLWLKRAGGGQVVADHQGMSYRKMQ